MNKRSFLKWLKSAIIRAIKSIAQTAIASIGTASVVLSEFNWGFVLMTSGMAGIISLLMSFEKIPEEDTEVKSGTEQITQSTTQAAALLASGATTQAAVPMAGGATTQAAVPMAGGATTQAVTPLASGATTQAAPTVDGATDPAADRTGGSPMVENQ